MGGGALILIDTHALIWLDRHDTALGQRSRKLVDEALRDTALTVSAITFWEVAMLIVKGRYTMKLSVKRWRLDLLARGLIELPIDGEIGIVTAQLDDLHGDPADRFILATALANDATLLTADRQLLDWPGTLQRHDARLYRSGASGFFPARRRRPRHTRVLKPAAPCPWPKGKSLVS